MIDWGDQKTRAAYNLSVSEQHAIEIAEGKVRIPLEAERRQGH